MSTFDIRNATPDAIIAERNRRIALRARDPIAPLTPAVSRPLVPELAKVPLTSFGEVSIGSPPIARRAGNMLWLIIPHPPRTKKNSKRHMAQESQQYSRFREQVIAFITPWKTQLGLPLPDQRYNCRALFVTDNDRADSHGLYQGLADALENAGVVTNDRWLWSWDGSDQETAKLRPRVEITITPRG